MPITTAESTYRAPLVANKLFWALSALFFMYWIYGWFYCYDFADWIIENLLVVICLVIFVVSRKWHQLSDISILCIFVFVMLHLFGAFYAYTQNIVGEWFQDTFHLKRNPWDRVVHFSFGFLMAYPFREILMRRYKVSPRASWLLPIEKAFLLGTVFEMIEWGVAEFTTSETGETYVATQGDVWDAHKDIALAAVGAAIMMAITYLATPRKNIANP